MQEGTAGLSEREDRQSNHSIVLPPNAGRSLWVMGDHITLKMTGQESGGAFALWENTTPPGAGPPDLGRLMETAQRYALEVQVPAR